MASVAAGRHDRDPGDSVLRARAGEPRAAVLAPPIGLVATFVSTALLWSLAGLLSSSTLAAAVAILGFSLGPCLAGYLSAPAGCKPLLRRIVLISASLAILIPLAGR